MSFESMWSALAPIGREPSTGGYRRFAWTGEDYLLREWFAGEAAEHGLDLTLDRAGNQWAWWGDPDTAVANGNPGIVIGSHLDSVPDGGAFDGPLGVVSAFAAISELRDGGFIPARPIGVVNFGDEEGARFGIACAGSRLITGALAPDHARGLRDTAGHNLNDAMVAAGANPRNLGRDDETLRRIGTFVELHVEQGRALVELGSAVGVGSSIWPHGRWRFDLVGEANHAGTTRLSDRHDPMLTLAQVISAARHAAEQAGCVATVGKVLVEPNAVNAIPSRVRAWLDARGADVDTVRSVVAQVSETAGLPAIEESFSAGTKFDMTLATRLARLLDEAPIMGTGAGHDAGILAAAGVPAAMLFIRNPTGISHSPAEHAELADCLAGVDALATVVADLSQ